MNSYNLYSRDFNEHKIMIIKHESNLSYYQAKKLLKKKDGFYFISSITNIYKLAKKYYRG